MKPLPDLTDEPAMLLRGRRSAVGTARNETLQELRDACTYCQSADWNELERCAERVIEAARRLQVVAALWTTI